MMPIVYSSVKRLNIKGGGFDDAVQEGRIAVMKAIRTFNPDEGAKLSTWVYAKVGWRLKDWMDTETRARSGRSFKNQLGGAGNESRDWAPRASERAGIGGSGDDMIDLAYPYLAEEGAPEASACVEHEEQGAESLELEAALLAALEAAPADVRTAAESLLRGETIEQTAALLGKSPRTAWARRKQVAVLLEPFRSKMSRGALD